MTDPVIESLILDLLEWLATRQRSYGEVMEAWRTSCPKLPVWEDANERGFVAVEREGGLSLVSITESGRSFLQRCRPTQPMPTAAVAAPARFVSSIAQTPDETE
jgi:D-3-phosphoglycerate dehydrogenase